MRKIIPLPNFYKIAEKTKMSKDKRKTKKSAQTDSEMQPMTELSSAKMRTFASIATAANKMVTKVKEVNDEKEKMDMLKVGLQDCVRQLIEVSFERAEVNDIIVNQPDFQYLKFYDPSAIFTADLDKVQTAKVMSSLTNLQDTVLKVAQKPTNSTALDEKLVKRLEKVSNNNYPCSEFFK